MTIKFIESEEEVVIILGDDEKQLNSPKKHVERLSSLLEEGTRSMSYNEKTQTVKIDGEQNGYHITNTIQQSLGETITQTKYPILNKKSDYKDEVFYLYNVVGLKQIEIANRLNISQSLVSKLLKQNI